MDDLIGYKEAAKILCLPIGTLYSWVSTGKIAHYRFGPRLVRFTRSDVIQVLNDSCVESHCTAFPRSKELEEQTVD